MVTILSNPLAKEKAPMEKDKKLLKSWSDLAEWIYQERHDEAFSCCAFYECANDSAVRFSQRYVLSWQRLYTNRLIVIYKERVGVGMAVLLQPEMDLPAFKKNLYYFLEEEANCSKKVWVDPDSFCKAVPTASNPDCVRSDSEDTFEEVPRKDFVNYVAANIFREGAIDFLSQYHDWHRIIGLKLPLGGDRAAKLVICAEQDSNEEPFFYDASDDVGESSLVSALGRFLVEQQIGAVAVRSALERKIHGKPEPMDWNGFVEYLQNNFQVTDQSMDLIRNILGYAEGFDDEELREGYLKDMFYSVRGIEVSEDVLTSVRLTTEEILGY